MDSILKSYYLTGLTGFSGFFSFLVSGHRPGGLCPGGMKLRKLNAPEAQKFILIG